MRKFAIARRALGRLTLGERLLLLLSQEPPEAPIGSYEAPDDQWSYTTALNDIEAAFPGLRVQLYGARVLDHGCGDGWQAIALRKAGARYVQGVDIEVARLQHAEKHARKAGITDGSVRFVTTLRDREKFDMAVCQDVFEHLKDPGGELRLLRETLREGGRLYLIFGPLWWSPYGPHMYFFTPVPWLPLMFSERTVMRIRSLWRSDGAKTYAAAGLNGMTLRRFEDLIARSGFSLSECRYRCAFGLDFLGRIPWLREFFVNRVETILVAGVTAEHVPQPVGEEAAILA